MLPILLTCINLAVFKESLLPREPDQVILIRVNVNKKAVVMVDSATQVDCNAADKEVQTGLDPELERVSTENNYLVS